MSSLSRFTTHLMREEDRIPVFNLLIESFFHEEPLAKCLELGKPVDFAETVINDAMHDRCSFVAYDMQTNRLVGICINEIRYEDHPNNDNKESNDKLQFILQFLEQMHDNIDLFNQFSTKNLLHIFMLNVHPKYRGHGIASNLIASSIEHATNTIHIGGAYAEATSIHSLNPFQQQNFQIYRQVKYTGYDPVRLSRLNHPTYDQCYLVARAL